MPVGETGCTYAALILYNDGIPITAEEISILLKAANLTVKSYWPSLFSKLCEKRSVEDLILNVGASGGATVAVAAPTARGAAPAAKEKKEEPKEESDDDMGFLLFD